MKPEHKGSNWGGKTKVLSLEGGRVVRKKEKFRQIECSTAARKDLQLRGGTLGILKRCKTPLIDAEKRLSVCVYLTQKSRDNQSEPKGERDMDQPKKANNEGRMDPKNRQGDKQEPLSKLVDQRKKKDLGGGGGKKTMEGTQMLSGGVPGSAQDTKRGEGGSGVSHDQRKLTLVI